MHGEPWRQMLQEDRVARGCKAPGKARDQEQRRQAGANEQGGTGPGKGHRGCRARVNRAHGPVDRLNLLPRSNELLEAGQQPDLIYTFGDHLGCPRDTC